MGLSEVGIMVFGLLAIFLVNLPTNNKYQRYGCISGLCSQPFWFYTTHQAEQYGIVVLSFVYTALWAKGFYHAWLSKRGQQ